MGGCGMWGLHAILHEDLKIYELGIQVALGISVPRDIRTQIDFHIV